MSSTTISYIATFTGTNLSTSNESNLLCYIDDFVFHFNLTQNFLAAFPLSSNTIYLYFYSNPTLVTDASYKMLPHGTDISTESRSDLCCFSSVDSEYTIDFSLLSSNISNYIEIVKIGQSELDLSNELNHLQSLPELKFFNIVPINVSSSRIILSFSNSTEAIHGLRQLHDYVLLNGKSRDIIVVPIQYDHLDVVSCVLRSDSSADLSMNFNNTITNMTQTIQNSLIYTKENTFILNSYQAPTNKYVYLLVPSTTDKESLNNIGSIFLTPSTRLIVDNVSIENRSSRSNSNVVSSSNFISNQGSTTNFSQPKKLYFFWDAHTCFLENLNPNDYLDYINQIFININELFNVYSVHKEKSSSDMTNGTNSSPITIVDRVVFFFYPTQLNTKLAPLLSELSKRGVSIISYSLVFGVDTAMMLEFEKILSVNGMDIGSNLDSFSNFNNTSKFTSDIILGLASSSLCANAFMTKIVNCFGSVDSVCYYSDANVDVNSLNQFKFVKPFSSLVKHKLFLNNPNSLSNQPGEANVDNLFPNNESGLNFSLYDNNKPLGDISSLTFNSVFSPPSVPSYEPSSVNTVVSPSNVDTQPSLSALANKFTGLSINPPDTSSPFSNISCLTDDMTNQSSGNVTPMILSSVFPPTSTNNQTSPFISEPNFISSSLNLLNSQVKDVEFRIDVPSQSIFNFFNKLLEWGTPYNSVSISRNMSSFNSTPINENVPFFLSGENTIGYDSDIQYTNIVFDQNVLAKTFTIIVKGRSSPHVELRFLRIKDMVEAVNQSRQFVILTNWTNDHHLALNNSEVLTRLCESNNSWIQFHSFDDSQLRHVVSSYPTQSNQLPQLLPYSITAEIFSLSPKNSIAISHFLLNLVPKEETLRTSYSNISSQISTQLQYLHHKFAVKIDLKTQSSTESNEVTDSLVNFCIYGFTEYIESAVSSLLTFVSSSQMTNITTTPISLPTFTTRRHSSSNPPIYNSSFSSSFNTTSPFSSDNPPSNPYQSNPIENTFSPYYPNQNTTNAPSGPFSATGNNSVVSGGSGGFQPSFSSPLDASSIHSHYSVSSPNYTLNSNSSSNYHQSTPNLSHFSTLNSQASPLIPSNVNGLINSPMTARETIKKIQRGTYSFADREAGIYYFAFEQQFREYLERSFGVVVEDCNTNSVSNSLPEDGRPRNNSRDSRWSYGNNSDSNSANNTVTSGFSNGNSSINTMNLNKNVVLKISYYGNSIKNVSAARPYLEQLNTTNLIRTQIFFPQVSAKKFKEIYNKKAAQLALLNNVRMRYLSTISMSNNNELVAIDPLNTKGFINIRMKPPMHCQGIRRMILPTDVTVTICGSALLSENEALIREIEQVFLSIKSDYIFSSVSIPYSHPMKRNLTIKSLREEIINRFGIVSLKWEEGCRATGSVGTAKIWASTQESMDAILNEIRSVEEQMLAENQSALSAMNNLSSEDQKNNTENKNDDNLNLTNQGSESKSVIYLPDLTLRYVLLGPPLSTQLAELLQNFASKGIRAKYPYRDRTDPHAALLLEGDSEAVSQATKEANNLVKHATRELKVVQVIVSEEQYKVITNNDLICVKYIQGQAGVHIKLDPTNVELDSAKSIYDFKYYTKLKLISSSNSSSPTQTSSSVSTPGTVPSTPGAVSIGGPNANSLTNASNPLKSLPNLLTESSIAHTGISQDYCLISTQIATPSPYRFCELMVYSPEVGSYPWIYRVGGIIKIQLSETTDIPSQLEISQTIDPVYNKPVITGLIELSSVDNIQEKMNRLGELVKKLVIYACESGVQDLAFLVPIQLEAPSLTQNHIRIATIEALFYVILSHRSLQPINSIVAVDEFDYVKYNSEPSKIIASMSSSSNDMYGTSTEDYLLSTDANENNKMVSTLLALIEQQSLHNQDTYPTPLPSISLLRCNCPLPSNLLTPFITSGYLSSSSTTTPNNGYSFISSPHGHTMGGLNSNSLSGLNNKGFRTFLLKGLLPGINSGLGLLRNILTVHTQNSTHPHSLSLSGANR